MSSQHSPARVLGRRGSRAIEVEAILWMNDIVKLTGKHRCTIHRWMHEGTFPKKDAPKKEEPKKDVKKEEPKKDAPKKDEPKKDVKKEEPKKDK